MANYSVMAYAALFLVLLPMVAFGFDICSTVTCGKGKCQEKKDYIPYGYICDCDSGWKRTRGPESQEKYLQFLPCVIPNCSINYTCLAAATPLPPIPTNPYNIPAFDPCYWIYCGDGTCSKSSNYIHTCECHSGAYNLFNISHFPCIKECALGSDCSNLGINVSKPSGTTGSSPSPSPSPSTSPSPSPSPRPAPISTTWGSSNHA